MLMYCDPLPGGAHLLTSPEDLEMRSIGVPSSDRGASWYIPPRQQKDVMLSNEIPKAFWIHCADVPAMLCIC